MPYLSLFNATTPAVGDVNNAEGQPGITVGTRWFTDQEGAVHGIRFYLGTRAYDGGAVTVGLFDGASGTGNAVLGQKTYTVTSSDALGFVTVMLDTPVIVKRQYPYVAAVFMLCDGSPDGHSHYCVTSNFFQTSQFDNPPLHAFKRDAILDRQNGVFVYGSSLAYPTQVFNGACYFADVAFDYVDMVQVKSGGVYGRHPVKVRVGGQWVL
ncbi:MAG TPA: DUF4082 domain-containing protein [Candidatus Saccharimonadales bacterium]